MRLAVISMLAALAIAGLAGAVEPDEVLDDPVLEARARALSVGLRCLVCRNENIDESNADLARDLRLLVRERLVAGDSDVEVLDFMVARFGDFVLLKPRFSGGNIVLWLSAPALFGVGLGISLLFIRRRSRVTVHVAGLSEEEQARLDELLRE